LQATLKLILEAEPPCDIFVRWKLLAQQPIGWHPDLNDGVRMNIQSFATADILRKRVKIKWDKDGGTAAAIHGPGVDNMKRKLALVKSSSLPPKPGAKGLLADLREMILSARQTVATTANATLTMLYWQIGSRIRKDILREKRAEYGEQILSTLSKKLEAVFGRGFGRRNLFNMAHFAEVFPDIKIVQSAIAQFAGNRIVAAVPRQLAGHRRLSPHCGDN
jgi:hypothetical protein